MSDNNNRRNFLKNSFLIPFGNLEQRHPKRGEEAIFIGREGQQAFLVGELTSGKTHGSYLVTGRRGAGKTSFVESCLEEYKKSLFTRFLHSNHGRSIWDLLAMLLFAVIMAFSLLIVSELVQISAVAQKNNKLLLFLLIPSVLFCLLPGIFGYQIIRSTVSLWSFLKRSPGLYAVIIVLIAIDFIVFGKTAGAPAVTLSRFLLVISALVTLARMEVPFFFAFKFPSPLWWFVVNVIASLVAFCYIFLYSTNDVDGSTEFFLNISASVLIFSVGITFNAIKHACHIITDNARNRNIRDCIIGWAVMICYFMSGYLANKGLPDLLNSEEGTLGEDVMKIWEYLLILLVLCAEALVIVLLAIVFKAITDKSKKADEKIVNARLKWRPTPPIESLQVIKAFLLITISVQLLYPLANIHKQTFSHLIAGQDEHAHVIANVNIQNAAPLKACYLEEIQEISINSGHSKSCSNFIDEVSKDKEKVEGVIFSLFHSEYEEIAWLFTIVAILVLIFVIEYEWINRGLLSKIQHSFMGVTTKPDHHIHSHHDAHWQYEVAQAKKQQKRNLDKEENSIQKTKSEVGGSDKDSSDRLPHDHRDRIEKFRGLVRTTFPWLLVQMWMPSVIVRVNLGFDSLNHKGVIHAMLYGLHNEYRKNFTALFSTYRILANLIKILIIAFAVSFVAETLISLPINVSDYKEENNTDQNNTLFKNRSFLSIKGGFLHVSATENMRPANNIKTNKITIKSNNFDSNTTTCDLIDSSGEVGKAYLTRALCTSLPNFGSAVLPLLFAEIIPINLTERAKSSLVHEIFYRDSNVTEGDILGEKRHLIFNFLHVNKSLPSLIKEADGSYKIADIDLNLSFRLYHLLLFLIAFALWRWLSDSFKLFPYGQTLKQINNLLENLHYSQTLKRRRPFWAPVRYIRSAFTDEEDQKLYQERQDPRSVELAFLDILEEAHKDKIAMPLNIGSGFSLPMPEIIFVFDELDKITGVVGVDTTGTRIEEERSALDAEVRRAYALHRLLSDMKRIISSAPAKFIFVGNRLLHDEWAADQSRRQPLLTSIFDKEIYLPSLMLDHNTSNNTYGNRTYTHLSMRIREYIVRRKQLADDVYNRIIKDRSSSLLALSRHDPAETYYSADSLGKNEVDMSYKRLGEIPVIDYEIGITIKDEDNCWNNAFINSFIHFLTYRSAGNPKRLHELVDQFARPASRFSNNNIPEKYLECHHVLHFSNIDIFRVQLIDYIYMHIVERFETKLADRDDKVATALIYLLDFIMKFHPRAFSWETMERIDEMAHIHRTPGLRLILESLVNESSERLFHNLLNGMYAFRFRSELAKEIVYLSRISEEEGASFNFTLDEAQGLKASYIMALSKESDKDIDKTFALGNLYEYDEQYEDARKMYTQAISMLDEQLFHHVGRENCSDTVRVISPAFSQFDSIATLKAILSQDGDGALNAIWFSKWISYRLRLLLHMGLTYEISNNLETAKSEYMQARLLARAVIGIVASYANANNLDDKEKIVYNSAVDLLKHINVLYQPILAEAWVSEKMIGAVDTSGSLLESELIWLRRSLPFLNDPIATKDEGMTKYLKSSDVTKKEGGYANYNFSLIAAELHNKAGDLYFFKGQQRYHTERSLPNSANNGSIFRAHYHYAVALHEIRRSIFCRRVTSEAKLNAGLNKNGIYNSDDKRAFRKKDWPTFFGQSIHNTLTDLGDTVLARTSLIALLRENCIWRRKKRFARTRKGVYKALLDSMKYCTVEEITESFTESITAWMEKSDNCTMLSTRPNEKAFTINKGTKSFTFADLIKDYFGEWNFTEKDINSPYPVIVKFGKPSSHLVRLLVSLHLNAAGAEIAIKSGYVQNAAHEYLLLLEKLAGIIKSMRMIIHFDEDYFFADEVAKLSEDQNKSLLKYVRSKNKRIVSYLTKFAAEIAQKYDNLCFAIWRRRPNSNSGNYLLGNRISIEAATALISIRLSMADSKYSGITSKNFNASCDKLLRKWLGKSSCNSYLKDAFQGAENYSQSINSLSFRRVLSYLLTRHRFPILNHLLMLKILIDDITLCYHVNDKHPSNRMHPEFASEVLDTERWARELRIASERYDAPMHFSPYMYGETAALLVLSGVEGYYYEEGRKSMTLGESPLGRGGIESLIKSRESYSMGRQYYENISSLYYLYDDFNDRRMHSTHAMLMSGSDIAAHLERALVKKFKAGSETSSD